MKRPNTCTNLIRAIKAVAADADAVRLSRQLANVIVGQMLPDGVIKGGSSLMFRYGSKFTRYTRDVDTARIMEHGEYIGRLQSALATGWNGFTADLVEIEPGWETIYEAALGTISDKLYISRTVDEAIVWVNEFIDKIIHG